VSDPADAGRRLAGRDVPAAVLFDMDGLLVATEHVWFEVESALVRELGGEWGPADQEQLVGGPLERTVAYMASTVPGPVDEDDLRLRLLAGMVERLRHGPVDWMPGARRLLDEVTGAGIPLALVSSSRRPVVDAVLTAIGSHLFPVTVSGDDVERTKPHPDPYLLAAALLEVEPTSCVALEDSATGATAARAAGCVTVVVPSIASVPDGVAHHRAQSLEELGLDALAALVLAHS
jgi:HAD superfamily hydrolase (TIGR01509 family)